MERWRIIIEIWNERYGEQRKTEFVKALQKNGILINQQLVKNLIYLFGNQENRRKIQMKQKLTPIAFDKTMELSAIFDICHNRFKETITTKDRPLFQGMEIYVPLKWIEVRQKYFAFCK